MAVGSDYVYVYDCVLKYGPMCCVSSPAEQSLSPGPSLRLFIEHINDLLNNKS